MLVNYKKANVLTVEMGVGKTKLVLIPGINMVDDNMWKEAEKLLGDHIKAGKVSPIYKVSTKNGKEEKSSCTPDEIPDEQIDSVIKEIQNEDQADKVLKASKKESVRAKVMNRKLDLKESK